MDRGDGLARRLAVWCWVGLVVGAWPAGAAPGAVQVLTGALAPRPGLVGHEVLAGLSAVAVEPPQPAAELQIVGPVWTWALAQPLPAGVTAQLSGSASNATLKLTSSVRGEVAVGVTATCRYVAPETGQVWEASGSGSVTATFVELVGVAVSGATAKTYPAEGETAARTVWGAPQRQTTADAPAPRVTLTAFFEPVVTADQATGLLTWSDNAEAVDAMTRAVSTSSAGELTVTATADKAIARTVKVAAWEAGPAPTVGLTGTIDGEAASVAAGIQADPGMVVDLGLANWADADANEFAPDEQDASDAAATQWTVAALVTNPDTQEQGWVARPDLGGTGLSYRFVVPCGGTYRLTATVPDKGLRAKDSAGAAASVTVSVQHPCGQTRGG